MFCRPKDNEHDLTQGPGKGLAANKLSLTVLAAQSERNGLESRDGIQAIGYTPSSYELLWWLVHRAHRVAG